jgi:RES domain
MIVYRFATYGTPLRTVSASQPGRYNFAAEPDPTQYLALHPLGPLAELMRNADLRMPDQIRAVRTRTWALDVRLDDVPEVTFDTAAQYEISADELVSDDYRACQGLAGRLREQAPGLIAPSAALPGTRNAILFGPRVASPYLTTPVSELDVPASITAEDGRPLESLADIVRFKGDTHLALDAWQRDAEFRFAEPDWSLNLEGQT